MCNFWPPIYISLCFSWGKTQWVWFGYVVTSSTLSYDIMYGFPELCFLLIEPKKKSLIKTLSPLSLNVLYTVIVDFEKISYQDSAV